MEPDVPFEQDFPLTDFDSQRLIALKCAFRVNERNPIQTRHPGLKLPTRFLVPVVAAAYDRLVAGHSVSLDELLKINRQYPLNELITRNEVTAIMVTELLALTTVTFETLRLPGLDPDIEQRQKDQFFIYVTAKGLEVLHTELEAIRLEFISVHDQLLTTDSAIQFYNGLVASLDKEWTAEFEELQSIERFNMVLLKHTPLIHTKPVIITKERFYSLKNRDGTPIDHSFGLRWWNKLDTHINGIYYLALNSRGHKTMIKTVKSINKIPELSSVSAPESLFLAFDYHDEPTIIHIDLTTMVADVILRDDLETMNHHIIEVINSMLEPTQFIADSSDGSVSGSCVIYNKSRHPVSQTIETTTPIIDIVFSYFMLIDPISSYYGYLNEKTKLVVGRQKIPFVFYEDNVNCQLTQEKVSVEHVMEDIDGDRIEIREGDYTIKIDVTHANSDASVSYAIEVLARIISRYHTARQLYSSIRKTKHDYSSDFHRAIEAISSNLFNTFQPPGVGENGEEIDTTSWPLVIPFETVTNPQLLEYRGSQYVSRTSRLQVLEGVLLPYGPTTDPVLMANRLAFLTGTFPDVFVKNYARAISQSDRKPMIFPESKIDEWRRSGREVLPFPRENPLFYFACPSPKFKWPGVRVNNLANKAKYSHLPTCFESQQYFDSAHPKAGSTDTSKYYNQITTTKAANPKGVVDTIKLCKRGQRGQCIAAIRAVLNDESQRLGMTRGPMSFLECVLYIEDKKYFSSDLTDDDIEDSLIDLRRKLVDYSKACRQELYDHTDAQIKQRIYWERASEADAIDLSDDYIDSNIFYRLVEEYLKVNVFVIIQNKNDAVFEIPRHHGYHSRSYNSRPAMVVVKHVPTEENGLDYPQYELVLTKKNSEHVINPVQLYSYFVSSCTHYSWHPDGINIIASESITNKFRYDDLKIFKGVTPTLYLQHINSSGKTDYCVYQFAYATQHYLVTIMAPATQPLLIQETNQIEQINYKIAMTVLGAPVKISIHRGYMVALWYQLAEDIYGCVPVIPVADWRAFEGLSYEPTPIGYVNLLDADDVSMIQQYRDTYDLHTTLVDLVNWAARVAWRYQQLDLRDYMVYNPEAKYDVSGLDSSLPIVDQLEQVLGYIKETVPGFVIDGYLAFHSEHYYQGMLEVVRKVLAVVNMEPADIEIPTMIKSRQLRAINPTKQGDEIVFNSQDDFKKWQQSKRLYGDTTTNSIYTKLNVELSYKTQPIIYRDQNGSIYIIQRCLFDNDSLARALTICKLWKTERYVADPDVDIDPEATTESYNVLTLTSDGNLGALKSFNPTATYELFTYDNGRYYFALLPLN